MREQAGVQAVIEIAECVDEIALAVLEGVFAKPRVVELDALRVHAFVDAVELERDPVAILRDEVASHDPADEDRPRIDKRLSGRLRPVARTGQNRGSGQEADESEDCNAHATELDTGDDIRVPANGAVSRAS